MVPGGTEIVVMPILMEGITMTSTYSNTTVSTGLHCTELIRAADTPLNNQEY